MININEIDALTIKRSSKGDFAAFRLLYNKYAPFIWKVIYRSVNGDELSAREILQETFVRAYRGLGKFREDSGFSTWLYRLAWNATCNWISRKSREKKRTVEFDESLHGVKTGDSYEDREFVDQILSGCTTDERFLISAVIIDGFTFDELAEITGRHSGALRTQITRLKQRIRKEFEDEYRGRVFQKAL